MPEEQRNGQDLKRQAITCWMVIAGVFIFMFWMCYLTSK
jgi:hypothetical protein